MQLACVREHLVLLIGASGPNVKTFVSQGAHGAVRISLTP